MEVAIEHIGIPSFLGSINVNREIDESKSFDEICQDIKGSVPDNFKGVLLGCEAKIFFTHRTGCDLIFDADVNNRHGFVRMLHHEKKLKVVWKLPKNTEPSQRTGDASTQTDFCTTTTDLLDTSLINTTVNQLILIKNSQSQSDFDKTEKNEFDKIISEKFKKNKIDPNEMAEISSEAGFIEFFKRQSSSFALNDQGQRNGQDTVSMENATTLKRSSSPKADQSSKKPKIRPPPKLPTEMISLTISANGEVVSIRQPYDATSIPVIDTFDPGKMIHFPSGINPIGRDRYITDSERPPYVQSRKTANTSSRDRVLPVVKLSVNDHAKLMAGASIIMGFARVIECQKLALETGEEIEYGLVGYIQYKYFADEKERMRPMEVIYPNKENGQAEQLIFKITKPSNERNEYKLMAHPFRVKDKIHDEIGPAMFRLSAEYIRAVQASGITFNKEKEEQYYAAFLFKCDEGTNQYVPDFESLYLSCYEFPKNKNDSQQLL